MPSVGRGPRLIALAFVATSGAACGLALVGPAADDVTPSSFDGSDDRSTNAADTAVPDGSTGDSQQGSDAKSDASDAGDANQVDSSVCPALCTDCNGGRCNITCPGPKCTSPIINCSPGLPCRVDCTVK